MFQPRKVDVPLALLLKVRDLDQGKATQELRDALGKAGAFRVELHCREVNKGFERLQSVLKANGVTLMVDSVAQTRLKLPRVQSNYVVYAEDLSREDLVRILQRVAENDKKLESQFSMAVVTRLTEADYKELAALMGVEPALLMPPKSAVPLGVDPRKPVADGTADQVAKNLAGQGSSAPRAKSAEHLALVMPSTKPSRPSAEAKRFLDARKPASNGAIQILLVLRGNG